MNWAALFLAAGLLTAGVAAPAAAQGTVRRHLVYFRDKAGSPFSVNRYRPGTAFCVRAASYPACMKISGGLFPDLYLPPGNF